VPIAQRVRTNITVITPPGVTTKLNEPGPRLDDAQIAALTAALVDPTRPGDLVMLSGSLAPGLPDDYYAGLIAALHARGAWVGLDTSDVPLTAVVAAMTTDRTVAPDFMKPNAFELSQITGGFPDAGQTDDAGDIAPDIEPIRQAAAMLRDAGVGDVLVTLGAAGALLVTDEGAWTATTPPVRARSTVGAGDCATGGYLIAKASGYPYPQRLAMAVAYGAAAVALPGTGIPRPADVHPKTATVHRLV
jgi:1-phosphofructokinase family hexose kinase